MQVTGVDADPSWPADPQGVGGVDGSPDTLGDVVGVNQDRGVCAERYHLVVEGLFLTVRPISERVGVGAGPGCGDLVQVPGLEVAGRIEPSDVGSTGAPGAHLDHWHALGGGHHSAGSRHDGTVMVHDGQQQRLQQHAVRERANDCEDGGVREVQGSFRLADDDAAELVVTEVSDCRLVNDRVSLKVGDLLICEPEVLDRLDDATDSTNDPVPASLRQAAGEQVEDCSVVRPASTKHGLEHRHFVLVCEESGGLHSCLPVVVSPEQVKVTLTFTLVPIISAQREQWNPNPTGVRKPGLRNQPKPRNTNKTNTTPP